MEADKKVPEEEEKEEEEQQLDDADFEYHLPKGLEEEATLSDDVK